jgi:flagellar protein FlbB
MAEKKTTVGPFTMEEQSKTSKPRGLFRKLLILFVVLVLGAVGFASGIYLKLVDLPGLAKQWKLYDYPVIGQYFEKPQTNFEPVELDAQGNAIAPRDVEPAALPSEAVPQQSPPLPLQTPLTDAEKEKLAKAKVQEETKRVAKLARMYENMKPAEVVAILNNLDDATVLAVLGKMDEDQAAKILGQMDAGRAARLSQSMLRGNDTVVQ